MAEDDSYLGIGHHAIPSGKVNSAIRRLQQRINNSHAGFAMSCVIQQACLLVEALSRTQNELLDICACTSRHAYAVDLKGTSDTHVIYVLHSRGCLQHLAEKALIWLLGGKTVAQQSSRALEAKETAC